MIGDPGHPPVNFHAYAACARGIFASSIHDIPPHIRHVLLLLRPRHLAQALRVCRTLRASGRKVFISWKECGAAQVAAALASSRRWRQFQAIARACDGFLSATPDIVPVYQAAGCPFGDFIPTPYPVDMPGWDCGIPLGARSGIFIGTREFGVPSRNHLLALCAASRLGAPVTVMDSGEGTTRRILESLPLRVVCGPLPYPEYLALMASHRIVFQLDSSGVPGQVAGDALLCRMPCVGGSGAIETLAFPQLANGRSRESASVADRLLQDDAFWLETVRASQEIARKELSFQTIARRLAALLSS